MKCILFKDIQISSIEINKYFSAPLIILLLLASNYFCNAQLKYDLRTISEGYWHSPEVWEVYNGMNWVKLNKAPDTISENIEIRHNLEFNLRTDYSRRYYSPTTTLKINFGVEFKVRNRLSISYSTPFIIKNEGVFNVGGSGYLRVKNMDIVNLGILQLDSGFVFYGGEIALQNFGSLFVNGPGKFNSPIFSSDLTILRNRGVFEIKNKFLDKVEFPKKVINDSTGTIIFKDCIGKLTFTSEESGFDLENYGRVNFEGKSGLIEIQIFKNYNIVNIIENDSLSVESFNNEIGGEVNLSKSILKVNTFRENGYLFAGEASTLLTKSFVILRDYKQVVGLKINANYCQIKKGNFLIVSDSLKCNGGMGKVIVDSNGVFTTSGLDTVINYGTLLLDGIPFNYFENRGLARFRWNSGWPTNTVCYDSIFVSPFFKVNRFHNFGTSTFNHYGSVEVYGDQYALGTRFFNRQGRIEGSAVLSFSCDKNIEGEIQPEYKISFRWGESLANNLFKISFREFDNKVLVDSIQLTKGNFYLNNSSLQIFRSSINIPDGDYVFLSTTEGQIVSNFKNVEIPDCMSVIYEGKRVLIRKKMMAKYEFIGSGLASNPNNWLGGKVPSIENLKCSMISINPSSGSCIWDLGGSIKDFNEFIIAPGKIIHF